ncbi:MAG: molybdenum cofactor guanylyltransferase [Cyclobacteriaceae bacterium]|nr:molybdenum cofactor guanylyltransferase [Cyclobacteriaceae bacterium]
MEKITAIVLCGGESSRMGTDKGMIDIMGRPMVEHVITHVKPLCNRILISTNFENYKYLGYEVIEDQWQDHGPAAGILSCLLVSETEINLVVSCDLPMATTMLFEKMYGYAGDSDITVPRINTHFQPLCGFYRTNIRDRFREYLMIGEKSMQFIIQYFNFRLISQEMMPGIDLEKELQNFNTPEDIENLKKTL